MSKLNSRLRYLRPPQGIAYQVDASGSPLGAVPEMPSPVSVAEQQRRNRRTVPASLVTLYCRTRGCRERIAELELDQSRTTPVFRLAIHAPWLGEPASAPEVVDRFRLTGAFDPETSPVYVEFVHWKPGSRVEIVCCRGHESALDVGALTAAIRRAITSVKQGSLPTSMP